MNITNVKDFKRYVVYCYPQEACGIVKNGLFIPIHNVSESPTETFSFSPADSFDHLDADAIVHSHTANKFTDDPRTPSFEDMQGAENTGKPWGIVHCDGENVTDILWFNEPTVTVSLIGRDYIAGVYDCFTLMRDYYRINYGTVSSIYPRPPDWQTWNPTFMEASIRAYGFTDKALNAPRTVGDVVLLAINSDYINHIGVVLENDGFLHHMYNRKSTVDTLSKWNKFIRAILEYKV